jgi:hypothetical protein
MNTINIAPVIMTRYLPHSPSSSDLELRATAQSKPNGGDHHHEHQKRLRHRRLQYPHH